MSDGSIQFDSIGRMVRRFSWPHGCLCVLGFVVCSLILPENPPWVMRPWWRVRGMLDATSFRTAAQLVGTPGLYDPASVRRAQERELGGGASGVRVFLRPPWYAAALRWLAWPPYHGAIAIWKLVLLLCVAASVWLWHERAVAALAFAWSLPTFAALEQGQDTLLFLALFSGALRLLDNRPAWAGGILSLCTIKFHLLLFVPILLLRNPRLAKGFILGVVGLFMVSVFVQGASWPVDFVAQLLSPLLHSGVTAMPSVAGLLPGFGYWTKAVICLIAALLLARVIERIQRTQSQQVTLAAAVAAGLIVAPHAYAQDIALVIPFALFTLVSHPRVSIALLSPLVSYWPVAWVPVVGAAVVIGPVMWLLLSLTKAQRAKNQECKLLVTSNA